MRALLIPILFAHVMEAEAGLRCDARVVSVGRRTIEVRALCGDPSNVEVATETRISRQIVPQPNAIQRAPPVVIERRVTVTIERWTYVFGPERLIQTLVFENGVLVSVSSEGRPPSAAPTPTRCEGVHSRGDTTTEVYLRCGPPADRQEWFEEQLAYDSDEEIAVTVPFERWTYNLGPHKLLRILTFEGGRLVLQETGRYGY